MLRGAEGSRHVSGSSQSILSDPKDEVWVSRTFSLGRKLQETLSWSLNFCGAPPNHSPHFSQTAPINPNGIPKSFLSVKHFKSEILNQAHGLPDLAHASLSSLTSTVTSLSELQPPWPSLRVANSL